MKNSEKQKAKQRQRYYDRKASGLCMYCSYPAQKGHIRCAAHREITADYSAGIRDIRKVKGLCATCGNRPPAMGFVSCDECRAKWKNRRPNLPNNRGVIL